MKPWEQFADPAPWEQFAGTEEPKPEKPPKQYKIGAAGLPDAIREVMPNFSPLSRVAMGAYSALDNAALRAKQLLGGGLSPQDEVTAQANRAVARDPYALGGKIGGTVLGTMGIGGPGLPSAIATGGGLGYLSDPVLGNESGAARAAQGALFGGLLNLGVRGLTGASVIPQTEQSKALLAAGGAPTIGQTLQSNPSAIAQSAGRLEEKLQSVPLLGDAITAARMRGLNDWRSTATNIAAPAGAKISSTGDEGLAALRQAWGDAYDDIYRGVSVVRDPKLSQDLANARNLPALPLNAERSQQYGDILRKTIFDRVQPGVAIPASVAKTEVEAALGQHARNFSGPLRSPEEQALGEALYGARDAWRGLMARSINDPAKLAQLQSLDKGYPAKKAVEAATERARAAGGEFTPFQLQSVADRGTPIRNWADIGQAVLPTRVPNSFTADRAAVGNLLSLGLTGGLGSAMGSPALLGAAALPLAYSRTGTRWLQGAISPEELQMLAPYLSQAGTAGLLNTFERPIK